MGRTLLSYLSPRSVVLVLIYMYLDGFCAQGDNEGELSCYSRDGLPRRCSPLFVNAAFNMKVEATNTCGVTQATRFCVQTGAFGARKSCDICDAKIPQLAHNASFLTDFNNPDNVTWWQSETMAQDIQYPHQVNLTLKLGKAFDITYIRLKFHGPRPESFAIYKKTTEDGPWIPWQYYSATCRSTYSVPDRAPILPTSEAVAQCTSEYSDISPLTGANVPFSTLEGRPSAQEFDQSSVLQEWVTAIAMKVTLDRLNTFGDEVFRDERVLQSYYYAISDLAVGGRCKCNGHAKECVRSTGGGEDKLVCECEHNTDGADCEKCKPFYNDRPWQRATADNANECKQCNCSGLSNRCIFDEEMYTRTGSGGRCVECQGYTTGPHCESCVKNHYRRPGDVMCTPCHCSEIGSFDLQCQDDGQCRCKPGVSGQLCDRCQENFYDFSVVGCRECGCVLAGSYGNQQRCDPHSGTCSCKANVEGKQCDRCKPGFYYLAAENEFGCLPCFCYGHSSKCQAAGGFYTKEITSDFVKSADGWKGEDGFGRKLSVHRNDAERFISIMVSDRDKAYFLAPEKFLGDQRLSYNQFLRFKLWVDYDGGERASTWEDIVLEGEGGRYKTTIALRAQNNPAPTTRPQEYRFRLHEDSMFGWSPRLQSLEFMGMLSNLTAIKIRGTYSERGISTGYLESVVLDSASDVPNGHAASHVETCDCPEGHMGQYCQDCVAGYRRERRFGSSFSRCIRCNCHNHTEQCEAESGRCLCNHNTDGDECERCANGYYGNALKGTPDDCQPCPCPNQGRCLLYTDGEVTCLDCPPGRVGRLCESCADGYFGDPKNNVECKACECNGNIDPNSIGNCHRVTGECKKCIFNTAGSHCELCLPGFYGDALNKETKDCKACSCYPPGTVKPSADYKLLECNQATGQCECLPHVQGLRCNECEPGFYNLTSGAGCQSCDCDVLGSRNTTCNIATGQCDCKPGVTGRKCDQCQALHYGFGAKGCDTCNCLPLGSKNAQCDLRTGQCPCRPNIEGRQCDHCAENMHNMQIGCVECPPCYGLIQRRVNEHRKGLKQLREVIQGIKNNPQVVNDTNFEKKLKEITDRVDQLERDVENGLPDDTNLGRQLQGLRERLVAANRTLGSIQDATVQANRTNQNTERALKEWVTLKEGAYKALEDAQRYLDQEGLRAYHEAEEASKTFGQQSEKLTNIAQEARGLAAEHTRIADNIEKYAQAALNTSREARDKAQRTTEGSAAVSQEIEKMKGEYNRTEALFNRTRKLAEDEQDKAEDEYNKAAGLLAEVNQLKVPTVDTGAQQDAADGLIKQAKGQQAEAEKLIDRNQAVETEAKRVQENAEYELGQADKQQQIADKLLAEVDAAREKAKQALELAESTLKEANATLYTLQEFDHLVNASKEEAKRKQLEIPAIEQMIRDAENRTTQANKTLGGADEDARKALDIAKEANNTALAAKTDAMRLLDDAQKTLDGATKQQNEWRNLATDIGKRKNTLVSYDEKAKEYNQKMSTIASNAASARKKAESANKTADDVLDALKRIQDALNTVDTVSDDDLDKLEQQLKEAEETLEQAKLEQTVSDLKGKRDRQDARLRSYQNEIDRLEQEVRALREIRDSLPDQCFNVVELEQK